MPRRFACLLLTALAVLALPGTPTTWAEESHVQKGDALLDKAEALIKRGRTRGDQEDVFDAMDLLEKAQKHFQQAATNPAMTKAQSTHVDNRLDRVGLRIQWCRKWLRDGARAEAPPSRPAEPEPHDPFAPDDGEDDEGEHIDEDVELPELPPLPEGGARGPWVRAVLAKYKACEDGSVRGALAQIMAARAEGAARNALFRLFDQEKDEAAHEGIRIALADLGGAPVAQRMRRYARKAAKDRWEHALDVLYRALEKKDKVEPEGPFVRSVQAFHELKDRDLSKGIIDETDGMGREGVAALGCLLFVKDFGWHSDVVQRLSGKRDRRAVPPLVHKMNRFKFDPEDQMPAHRALLAQGWHAVPELILRLNDRATGIWISWTLRKITGKTYGTQRRKWHEWWKAERIKHPEVDRRPEDEGPVTGKR